MRILKRTPRLRRASVGAHLVVAFGACLLALGTLMALTTASSFDRERQRAAIDLQTAAEENVRWADETMPGAVEVLGSVSTQAGITRFDATECAAVFSGLASISSQGHLHLFRPDGSLVCSLRAPELPAQDVAAGGWFDEARTTQEAVDGGTAIDPISGRPAITIALPVDGQDGQVHVHHLSAAVVVLLRLLQSLLLPPPELIRIICSQHGRWRLRAQTVRRKHARAEVDARGVHGRSSGV